MIGWTPFFSQLSSLSLLSITVRLLLTTVFAGTLGYEREAAPAGGGLPAPTSLSRTLPRW